MSDIDTNVIRTEIHRSLRQDILACAIPPGADIHEAELIARFGVSKSPIRDALLRLEAEKLIVIRPRKGYQAAPISVADAKDQFECRAVLEPGCAMNAAETASDAALAELDRFRDGGMTGDEAAFVAYNKAFHLALANLCANRRLREATIDVIEHFDRLVMVSLTQMEPARRDGPIAEHCEIIDALQAREGKRAARILAHHARRARKRVLEALARASVVP